MNEENISFIPITCGHNYNLGYFNIIHWINTLLLLTQPF